MSRNESEEGKEEAGDRKGMREVANEEPGEGCKWERGKEKGSGCRRNTLRAAECEGEQGRKNEEGEKKGGAHGGEMAAEGRTGGDTGPRSEEAQEARESQQPFKLLPPPERLPSHQLLATLGAHVVR